MSKSLKFWLGVIFVAIIAPEFIIGCVELHRHWTDKTPEDVESFSTLAMALLTFVLAAFNWRLASDTHAALELAREEFRLSQEQARIAQAQFETEWRPDIRIAEIRTGNGAVELTIANLARSAALIKQVKIGTGGATGLEPQDIAEYPFTVLVKAGEIEAAKGIRHPMQAYMQQHLPQTGPRGTLQVVLNLALIYDCAGQSNIVGEWSRCNVNSYYSQSPKGIVYEVIEAKSF